PATIPAAVPAMRPAGLGLKAGLVLMAFTLVLAFGFQGTRSLWEPDEGRYAECAREMLVTGDFLTPRLGFEPHFTKPPLTYWSIAAPVALFGRNPWAARLYLSLAYLATVLLVAALGARLWNRATGLLAGVIYATSLLPFIGASIATPDTLLVLWEVLALYAFWRGWTAEDDRDRFAWPVVTGLAFGLAFLTKGPPGLLFLPAMLGFRASPAGRRAGAAPLLNVTGAFLFLVVGGAWYLAVILRNKGLLPYFLADEVIGRLAGKHHRNAQWYGALVVYVPSLLLGSFPWTFLWPAMWRHLDPASRGRGPSLWRARPKALLLALLVGIPLVVFTVSRSRLPLYVLPLFAPLALAAARAAALRFGASFEGLSARFDRTARHRWAPRLAAWTVALLGLRVAAAYWPNPQDDLAALRRLALPKVEELVFINAPPRYGMAFYAGLDVEATGWHGEAAGSREDVEDEIEEVRQGNSHVFFLSPGEEGRFRKVMDRAGVQARERIELGHLVAYVVTPPDPSTPTP
ncbi:MAG TPA: glycosyltransferase family 39 protein, partial [Candidatus Eisenbacteria bacterium]